MQIEFIFNTGRVITTTVDDFDSADFAKQLNNPQVIFISIGNRGFQKHTLIEWGVVQQDPTE
ncbi:hypothetical protein MKY34_19595 [Sporosarcina sp. FSL K6-1522]|uniref:hypothetical protein n=1 Tax=Sporosarcina sp. FSL K6-1522 TaxID=2921554 RepID=UPI00315B04B1